MKENSLPEKDNNNETTNDLNLTDPKVVDFMNRYVFLTQEDKFYNLALKTKLSFRGFNVIARSELKCNPKDVVKIIDNLK